MMGDGSIDFEGEVFGWAERYLTADEIGDPTFTDGNGQGAVANYKWHLPAKDAHLAASVFKSSMPNGEPTEFRVWADGRILLSYNFHNNRTIYSSKLHLHIYWRWKDGGHVVSELPIVAAEEWLRSPSQIHNTIRPRDDKLKGAFDMLAYPEIEIVGHLKLYNRHHYDSAP